MKKTFRLLTILITLLTGMNMQAQDPYAALSDGNTVLTFYYDNQKEARGGMSIGPFTYYNVDVLQQHLPGWYQYRSKITSVLFDERLIFITAMVSKHPADHDTLPCQLLRRPL